jgi:chaperonin GroEL
MKEIIYSNDARMKLRSGVNKIAKAVKVTLGPSGRNVLISNSQETRPFSTKDGVTVAGQIWSDDPIEQVAIESLQDIANNTDESVGDGTTTATVIAEAIIEAGLNTPKHINLLDMKRGIDQAVKFIVELLKKNATDIQEDDKMLKQVALISSNYDEEIADIVFRAFKTAGKQGVVNIKRSRDFVTHLTTIEGMTLPTGYRSKYYVNDHANDTCVMEQPYVFMTNQKIGKFAETNFGHLVQQVSEFDGSLLIICPDMDQAVSDMLIRNVTNGALKACVVRAPGFGNEQTELLRDLGVVLGKEPFLENEGIQFEDIAKDDIFKYIPQSEGANVGEQITSIKGAYGLDEKQDKIVHEMMEARAEALRVELSNTTTAYEKSQLQRRISRITDGIAYINIGAKSDTEFLEKQARIQDSLYAIKSAYEEGIIPGGGSALLSASLLEFGSKSSDEAAEYGTSILSQAIRQPFLQIIENVGVELTNKELNVCEKNFVSGFDAKTGKVSNDMIKSGIIDPVKVTRIALESATSIAGMLLTTECVVVNKSNPQNHPQQ